MEEILKEAQQYYEEKKKIEARELAVRMLENINDLKSDIKMISGQIDEIDKLLLEKNISKFLEKNRDWRGYYTNQDRIRNGRDR